VGSQGVRDLLLSKCFERGSAHHEPEDDRERSSGDRYPRANRYASRRREHEQFHVFTPQFTTLQSEALYDAPPPPCQASDPFAAAAGRCKTIATGVSKLASRLLNT